MLLWDVLAPICFFRVLHMIGCIAQTTTLNQAVPFYYGEGLFMGKKMPRRSRAIFSGRLLCFYGFIVLDACSFLDRIGFGFGFSFG